MALQSEDIKKTNTMKVLEVLYQKKTATMNELVLLTNFSQSTIRSLLNYLHLKELVFIEAIDKSTGGRRASRYTFSNNKFLVLSVFIDEGFVYFTLQDISHKIYYEKYILCDKDIELKEYILMLYKEYNISCVVIGSSGIIQDDYYYVDDGNVLKKHDIVEKLKKELSIPVLIENDVKAMLMGKLAHEHYSQVAYLYVSNTGVGSAFYLNNKIIRGSQFYSGELGLLPYYGTSINNILKSKPQKNILTDIYSFLIMTIAVTLDPQYIVLGGKNLNSLSFNDIIDNSKKFISNHYQLNIGISKQPQKDAMDGLHYIGILYLFDYYTDYRRNA